MKSHKEETLVFNQDEMLSYIKKEHYNFLTDKVFKI